MWWSGREASWLTKPVAELRKSRACVRVSVQFSIPAGVTVLYLANDCDDNYVTRNDIARAINVRVRRTRAAFV